ncbi:hypothetical protein KR009_010524 [Drosophila setifemur]|nr:hypothetical protein KR009_010524 [Drosophila setifemur]
MWNSQHFLTQARPFYAGLILIAISSVLLDSVIAIPTDQSYASEAISKETGMQHIQKRPAFFVGSRYGRSSGNAASGSGSNVLSSKSRRLIIVPRNDRFFLGSRYGKRNGEVLSPYEQSSLSQTLSKSLAGDRETDTSNITNRIKPLFMSCAYTGISNYYRCNGNDQNTEVNESLDSSRISVGDSSNN